MPINISVGVEAIKEFKTHMVNNQMNGMIRHDLLAPGIALGETITGWGTCCWSRTGCMQGQAAPIWEMGWMTRVKGGEQSEGTKSPRSDQSLSRRVHI